MDRSNLGQWIRLELAAIKVQRVFRQWMYGRPFRRAFQMRALRATGYRRSTTFRKMEQAPVPTPAECIQALVEQKADWSHQTLFWRTVIDIRRVFPNASTDLIVKSLLESNGEISRAHILLGTKEFCLQNKKPLPENVKALLLPHLDASQQPALSNPLLSIINAKAFGKQGGVENQMFSQWAESRRRNVDMVRSLRAQQKQKKKMEFMQKFSSVIDSCYFPKEQKDQGATRPMSSSGRPKTPNRRK